MNIIDVAIILILLLGGFTGAKNGFFKQSVVLLGTILCFVIAWYLKDPVANFLSYNLPFFNFAGPFEGLTSLNIVMYQLIAFLLIMAILSAILIVLVRMTGALEKVLKWTIILGIPSKILGFLVGLLEAYVILFIILFFMGQPAFDVGIIQDSKYAPKIVESSPVLSNVVEDMNKAIIDIYDINEGYQVNQNVNQYNKKVIDSLLDHKVIDKEYVNTLVQKGKIKY